MARVTSAQDLIPDLEFWIKHPTDPSLRKLLRKTVSTLQALVDLAGEPEVLESPTLPTLSERSSNNES